MITDLQKIDVIVILGGGITNKGVLSSATKERLDSLVKKRDEMPLVPIIVSGRWSGFKKVALNTTEAREMKKYLVKHKIAARRIITESASFDTISNAVSVRRIIERYPTWKSILLITSDWHMERAFWIFKKILGKDYQIIPLSVKSKEKIKKERKKYEKYLLNIAKRFLKDIPMDSEKLIKVLKNSHPFYSKSERAQKLLKAIAIYKEKMSL